MDQMRKLREEGLALFPGEQTGRLLPVGVFPSTHPSSRRNLSASSDERHWAARPVPGSVAAHPERRSEHRSGSSWLREPGLPPQEAKARWGDAHGAHGMREGVNSLTANSLQGAARCFDKEQSLCTTILRDSLRKRGGLARPWDRQRSPKRGGEKGQQHFRETGPEL